jgi:uncharacterized coiled-coil protein SlyX
MDEGPLDPSGRPLRTARSKVRTSTFRQVITRFWYLAVPLFGVVCSQDAYVRPHLLDAENTINLARVRTDQVIDSLVAEQRVIDGEAAAVHAEIDSTWQPQVELYSSVLDSLVQIRREYDTAIPGDEARLDSLRAVLAELQGTLQQASAELQRHQQTIDKLKDRRRGLTDSLRSVHEEVRDLADVYDRLANPDKYRKNTALVPGPGNWPNRDELPKR